MKTSADREAVATKIIKDMFCNDKASQNEADKLAGMLAKYIANCLTDDEVLNETIARGMISAHDEGYARCGSDMFVQNAPA